MQNLRQGISEIYDVLCERMDKYGDKRKLLGSNEMLTRYILIDPVLRRLGWNTEDPEQVLLSESISLKSKNRGYPDYTLSYMGNKVAYIEAKKWGTIYRIKKLNKIRNIMRQKDVRQLSDYCKEDDVPGILTDGGAWWVCNFKERTLNRQIKEKIDWGDDSKPAVVTKLLKLRPESISSC